MGGPLCPIEFLTDGLKGGRVLVISVHIAQQIVELLGSGGINSTVLFQAVVGPRPELLDVPTRFGNTDNRHIKVAALYHCLQCRKNLLVSQVAGGAEKYQGIGMETAHCHSPFRSVARVSPPAF
jgi:hypothetical protein